METPTPQHTARPGEILPLLPVTREQYAEAVRYLARIARQETSGGRAAAQVLLSAYNGYAFHLDVTDLCLLTGRELAAAITVLHGRADLRREPHECLKNGDAVFQQLWSLWEGLQVDNRHAQGE